MINDWKFRALPEGAIDNPDYQVVLLTEGNGEFLIPLFFLRESTRVYDGEFHLPRCEEGIRFEKVRGGDIYRNAKNIQRSGDPFEIILRSVAN